MQILCPPLALLQLECSALGCEHEKGWSLQWGHFCLLAHHPMQAETELGNNPTISSIPVYVAFVPQKRASKLEFGTRRQTEKFPISSESSKHQYNLPLYHFCLLLLYMACSKCQSTGLGCCKKSIDILVTAVWPKQIY